MEKFGSNIKMSSDGNLLIAKVHNSFYPKNDIRIIAKDSITGKFTNEVLPLNQGSYIRQQSFGESFDMTDDGMWLFVGCPSAEISGSGNLSVGAVVIYKKTGTPGYTP